MLTVRHVSGDFQTVWQAMRDFTDQRTPETPDELWFVRHPPVFTLGQAGKPEHILAAGDIPVVKTDRGGQVTYHGPGQLVGYCLFDLRRSGTVRHRLVLAGDAGWTRDVPGVSVIDVDGREAVLEFLAPGADRALLTEALRRGDVAEFGPIVPPLSEIYREVTA